MRKIILSLLVLPLLCSCKFIGLKPDADKLLAGMSIREKVCQMLIVAPEDIIPRDPVTQAGEVTKKAILEYPVGGLIYFSKNIESYTQLKEMVESVQGYSKTPLFIAVDEEGGRVARLGNADIGITQYPTMKEVGEMRDSIVAGEIGKNLAKELLGLGFNVDFAPVADVMTEERNTDIGDRSFGTDTAIVSEMVSAQVSKMQENGLIATVKHFPGNGSTEVNTHNGIGVSNRSLDDLRSCEFLPFKAGIEAGVDMVMVGHIAIPNATGDDKPASLSEAAVEGLLRGELGFTGVVVTDALNMGAVTDTYSPYEAAKLAILAGADVLLMPGDVKETAAALEEAVKSGEISEDRIDKSVRRILELKIKRGII